MSNYKFKDFIKQANDKTWSTQLNLFLDVFYKTPSLFCVLEEPKWSKDLSKENRSLLVSVIHRLCTIYKIKPPSWVMKKSYVLEEPYYLFKKGTRLHAYITFNALSEGVIRNVFITKDILKRV